MKEIKLTRGMVAMVDDEDFEFVNQWKWNAQKAKRTYYAARMGWDDGITKKIYMHRLINKTPSGMLTDHRDGNGLNNQKSNLRSCTFSENARNKSPIGTSKYLGVHASIRTHFSKRKNCTTVYPLKWRACINGKKTIGYFDTEIEAALAYNEWALRLHGEFARINIVEQ